MLEAVVTGDERIQTELVPAAQAIKGVVTFNEFQKIRTENPGASADEVIQIWAKRVNQAGDAYASKLKDHLKSLFDDFAAAGWFRTRDDKFGEVQKIGLGPTTDERVAIAGNLAAFRNRAVIKTLLFWAS